MKHTYLSFILIAVLTFLASCKKDKIQAENSIEGNWRVTEIVSQYGIFTNNTFIESQTERESGDLGTFSFTENEVTFSFSRKDSIYTNTAEWALTYERVNSGFTRVPKYTLTIGTDFIFDVFFEDGTKNSEKNAKRMTLTEIPQIGSTDVLTLTLHKD